MPYQEMLKIKVQDLNQTYISSCVPIFHKNDNVCFEHFMKSSGYIGQNGQKLNFHTTWNVLRPPEHGLVLTWMIRLVVVNNKHILSRVGHLPIDINHWVSMVQINKPRVVVVYSWKHLGQLLFITILKLHLHWKGIRYTLCKWWSNYWCDSPRGNYTEIIATLKLI